MKVFVIQNDDTTTYVQALTSIAALVFYHHATGISIYEEEMSEDAVVYELTPDKWETTEIHSPDDDEFETIAQMVEQAKGEFGILCECGDNC